MAGRLRGEEGEHGESAAMLSETEPRRNPVNLARPELSFVEGCVPRGVKQRCENVEGGQKLPSQGRSESTRGRLKKIPRGASLHGLFVLFVSVCTWNSFASGLYRDGYEVVETGPGGFFGAFLDNDSGTAWFGIDDSPARLIRVDLNTMTVTGKLELRKDEQRLWCMVKHGNFGYIGVESPGGRLVGVDLDKMERLGYATASNFPLLAGRVVGNYGYFSAGSNPATVMRLHLLQMQQGKCQDWDQCRFEVALQQGEEAVRSIFPDANEQHIFLALYTSPGRIVKLAIPSLTRVAHLDLAPGEDKILSGVRYGDYGIFGTATSPGRLLKIHLPSMTKTASLTLVDGEDRPATIIVKGRHAFIGFGSAWAEGTSSVLKVDLERMVRVSAIITKEGQTWLYTGLGYGKYAFFGTRGTATSKHATILRVNTNPTFPGIPIPPVFNRSGSDYIELNWLREYPEYHNGGAPIIGARVLLRPSNHHDWTSEHVYGYAAPDPAAPKNRISRVHEEPVDLEAHGYVARVDQLDAESGYKFAVILTNEVGPSHRSRSSLEMRTAVSYVVELCWVGFVLLVCAILGAIYYFGVSLAPRLDALYWDNESEEEAGSSLLRSGKVFISSTIPLTGSSAGVDLPEEGRKGLRAVAGKVANSFSSWISQPNAVRKLLGGVTLFSVLGSSSVALQYLLIVFVHQQQPWLEKPSRYLYSIVTVVCSGALAWAMASAFAALQAREYDHARRVAVASLLVAWATMISSITVIIAWTSSHLSPDTAAITAWASSFCLVFGLLGVVVETVISILRTHGQPAQTVTLPELGLSDWLTERL